MHNFEQIMMAKNNALTNLQFYSILAQLELANDFLNDDIPTFDETPNR